MAINIKNINNFFFVGIAGTGMSAIAQYLKGIGKQVSGSDRFFGSDQKLPIETQLEALGIHCFYQDGSGIDQNTEAVIVSTAIESSNPEYQKALQLDIPVIKRSEILAEIASIKKTIAVGGTSGKSTTTAMIFHIMQYAGKEPSLITGAGLSDLQEKGLPGNAWIGKSEWLIIEADESDGSIVGYKPEISVLLNIDRDHKEFDELMHLFETFRQNTQSVFIVNQNDKRTRLLSVNPAHDFGIDIPTGVSGTNFVQEGFTIQFNIENVFFTLDAIGQHNMENALAAIAVCIQAGISLDKCAGALKTFRGIYRRTQIVGTKNNITVIDDFAHNPAEVAAVIKSCQSISKRVIAWFQPHGYGPLRFMHEELTDAVALTLRTQDFFIMPDVYYAGGTVDRDVQSDSVIDPLKKQGFNAYYIPAKMEFLNFLKTHSSAGDLILIMGARDPDLSNFASGILS